MLKVEKLTKKYGKLKAVDDVSFEIASGEIAILAGPNGAGKSTLIKSIAGLLRYTGEVEIDGLPNKSLEAKRRLGYIPEMPATYDLLTVDEHMEFIARAYRLDNWRERADQLLERMELADNGGKLGKELSKGMQQKLSIVCALLPDPSVIIFDEPLVGLDPHAIKQLKAMFLELKQGGASLLISTHMLDSVEDYWDVVHIMAAGRFEATRRSDDATDGPSLEELFFEITEGKRQPEAEPGDAGGQDGAEQ